MNTQNKIPKVSICVITYNQEEYIRDCVESLIAQKASFDFEIIIRDDASSDSTPRVLKELQKLSSRVKLLDGSVNLGMNKNLLEVLNAANGEYIALCEGDDYWVDRSKIETQVHWLDKNPEINMCCHPVRLLKTNKSTRKILGKYSKKTTILSFKDILKNDGSYIATTSVMFRCEIVNKIPSWFALAPFGDYYLQAFAAYSNGCFYIPKPMAVYRSNSSGSWSEQMKDPRVKITFLNQALNFFDLLSQDVGEEYKIEIETARSRMILSLALSFLSLGDYKEFNNLVNTCWQTQNNIGKTQKIAYYLRNNPRFLRILYLISKKINKF